MVNLPFFVFVKGSTTWFIFDLFKVGKRLGVAADALPWAGCAEGGSILWKGWGSPTLWMVWKFWRQGNYWELLKNTINNGIRMGCLPSKWCRISSIHSIITLFYQEKNKNGWFTRNTMMIIGFRPRSHIFGPKPMVTSRHFAMSSG